MPVYVDVCEKVCMQTNFPLIVGIAHTTGINAAGHLSCSFGAGIMFHVTHCVLLCASRFAAICTLKAAAKTRGFYKRQGQASTCPGRQQQSIGNALHKHNGRTSCGPCTNLHTALSVEQTTALHLGASLLACASTVPPVATAWTLAIDRAAN